MWLFIDFEIISTVSRADGLRGKFSNPFVINTNCSLAGDPEIMFYAQTFPNHTMNYKYFYVDNKKNENICKQKF